MFVAFLFVASLLSVHDVHSYYSGGLCDHLQCQFENRYGCRGNQRECGDCKKGYLPTDRGRCIKADNFFEVFDGNTIHGNDLRKRENVLDDPVIDLALRDPPKSSVDGAQKSGDKQPPTTTPKPDKPKAEKYGAGAGDGAGGGAANAPGMGIGVLALIMIGCGAAGLVGLVAAGVCWYKLEKNVKDSSDVDYPAYGVTGPQTKERIGSPTDRKLAQSVQMYHYQHQKQQMIALEKANGEMKHDASDEDSEEENEEGDYTVYECPGLAPTGEMEVKNPLFSEEAPASPGPDKKDGSAS